MTLSTTIRKLAFPFASIALTLFAHIAPVMATPDMRAKFIEQGAEPVASTPAQFGDYIRSETAKWEKVVKLPDASAD